MFLPDAERFPPPYPAVLVVCGHSANGKAYDGYQRATALLALNGIAGFIIDPIGQGERAQLLNAQGKRVVAGSTDEHSLVGHGAVLLGRNTASFEVWDGMRAIDYLESRKDIDATKGVGCMGNSGGGTQTAYLMALDDRIVCASPACYITSFEELLHTIGPQDAEQNIFGQVAFGMNHADYILLRAPKPTLMCVATKDFFSIDGAWDSFRQAKRVYTRLGKAECVDIAEFDGPHGWSQPLREAAVQWMVRWLRGEDRVVREPEIDVFSDAELNVTPHGQVLLIDGAVSAFDVNMAENNHLAETRKSLWSDRSAALAGVQRTAKIDPGPKYDVKTVTQFDDGRGQLPRYIVQREGGVPLPIAVFPAESPSDKTRRVLYVSPRGWSADAQSDGPILKLVAQGNTVIAVDVSGIGETASVKGEWYNKRFGGEGRNATVAYLLGHSLLARRAEDIWAAAKFTAQEIEPKDSGKIDLVASGELGPPALHAAALHPELFNKVRIERSLHSFTSIVETPVVENQWVHMIHGALRVYDLPDLAASLGDKLELVEPVDASGKVIDEKKLE
jgi:hypothetical protein